MLRSTRYQQETPAHSSRYRPTQTGTRGVGHTHREWTSVLLCVCHTHTHTHTPVHTKTRMYVAFKARLDSLNTKTCIFQGHIQRQGHSQTRTQICRSAHLFRDTPTEMFTFTHTHIHTPLPQQAEHKQDKSFSYQQQPGLSWVQLPSSCLSLPLERCSPES